VSSWYERFCDEGPELYAEEAEETWPRPIPTPVPARPSIDGSPKADVPSRRMSAIELGVGVVSLLLIGVTLVAPHARLAAQEWWLSHNAGCVTPPFFSEAEFEGIVPGMPAAEALERLGPPIGRRQKADSESWHYSRPPDDSAGPYMLYFVTFDRDTRRVLSGRKRVVWTVANVIPRAPRLSFPLDALRIVSGNGHARIVRAEGETYLLRVLDSARESDTAPQKRTLRLDKVLPPLPGSQTARLREIGRYAVPASQTDDGSLPEFLVWRDGVAYGLPSRAALGSDRAADERWLLQRVLSLPAEK
jgi:hypothetical protein